LPANADTNTDADTDANTHCNSDTDANIHCNSNTDANPDPYADRNAAAGHNAQEDRERCGYPTGL
jgi:hypothetical protein